MENSLEKSRRFYDKPLLDKKNRYSASEYRLACSVPNNRNSGSQGHINNVLDCRWLIVI